LYTEIKKKANILASIVVHTGPKANTNKNTNKQIYVVPQIGYVHGGSRLYIIGGMIQTLNSTQYNPTKPSVSLLHSVFLSNLLFLTLTVALFSSAHLHSYIPCTLSSLSPFIGERRALAATYVQPNKCQPTTTIKKSWWLEKD